LRGKDWRKCFTPISNPKKLQEKEPNYLMNHCLKYFYAALPFDVKDILVDDWKKLIDDLLPETTESAYK
jgi:hypothetical protein